MKILITGYYGAGNFGDDIMLEAFCRELLKKDSSIKITILKMFDKELKIDLDKRVKIINYYKVTKGSRRLFKFLIRFYDMFLWVGGTCFTDQDGDGFYKYMNLALSKNVKIGYVGVGIGKLTIKERIEKTNYLIDKCSFISLRDKASYCYIKDKFPNKKNVYLTEDLAYLFVNTIIKNDCMKVKNDSKRKIVVSWRHLINYKSKEEETFLMNSLIKFMRKIMQEKNKSTILILPLDDRRDFESNKYIYTKLKEYENDFFTVIYKENLSPKEKIAEILSCDLNISARLHGIFVSEIANKKTIAISYSVKIDEFLKSIDKYEDMISIEELDSDKIEKIYLSNIKKLEYDIIQKKVILSKSNIDTLLKTLYKL